MSNSYLRHSGFGFYGAFASKDASNNTIKIRNNLTVINGTQNPSDRINIITGRTLAGEANFNVIDFKDSQASLPLLFMQPHKKTLKDLSIIQSMQNTIRLA